MTLLLGLITLCFFFWILFSTGDKKLMPLLFVLLCIENCLLFESNIRLLHTRRTVFLAFIFCLLFHYGEIKRYWNGFPFKLQLYLMLAASFIIAFFSECIPDWTSRISRPFFGFTGTCFIFFMAYVYSRKDSFDRFKQIFVACAILLTIAGVVNGILRYNPYIALLDTTEDIDYAHVFAHRERFRINSLFFNPFDYGYVCLILNVMAIYLKKVKIIGKRTFYTLFFCSFFGILSCNCRVVAVSYIIGILIYYLITISLESYVVYLLSFIIAFSIAYLTIPIVEQKTDQIASAFTDYRGEKVDGSSLKLRSMQLAGSFVFFKKSPVVGNGYDYIEKKLQPQKKVARKMAGYESVIFYLLIERGIVGIITYLVLYGSILVYLIKNSKYDINLAALGMAIFSMYMFFSLATSELLAPSITHVFLGIIIKQIEIRKIESFLRTMRICNKPQNE